MKSLFLHDINQKLQGFLPCSVAQYRAEIVAIFGSYFGRNDNFINSFWNLLTFKATIRKELFIVTGVKIVGFFM